jgi:hypothetical protein
MHECDCLWRRASSGKNLLLVDEGIVEDHRCGGEIPEHEFVALLGYGRRGGEIDDQRDAPLFGDLGDRGRVAGIEGADQELRTVAN